MGHREQRKARQAAKAAQAAQRRTRGMIFRNGMPVARADQVSVMSFNVLHPDSATREKYVLCPAECLRWKYRLPLIRDIILKYNTDIVCLQEIDASSAEEDFLSFFRPFGYEGVVQCSNAMRKEIDRWKTERDRAANAQDAADSKCQLHKPHTMCCLTLFKTSKFALESSMIRSRTLTTTLSHVCDAQVVENTDEEDQRTRRVHVVNVHLEADPAKVAQRTSQLNSALSRLVAQEQTDQQRNVTSQLTAQDRAALLSEVVDDPLVVCGDFNSTEGSETHRNMMHKYRCASAYRNVNKAEPDATYVGGRVGSSGCVDFVWFSPQRMLPVGVHRVLPKASKSWSHLLEEELTPSTHHPSDHLPVAALFDVQQWKRHGTEEPVQVVPDPEEKHADVFRMTMASKVHAQVDQQQLAVDEKRDDVAVAVALDVQTTANMDNSTPAEKPQDDTKCEAAFPSAMSKQELAQLPTSPCRATRGHKKERKRDLGRIRIGSRSGASKSIQHVNKGRMDKAARGGYGRGGGVRQVTLSKHLHGGRKMLGGH